MGSWWEVLSLLLLSLPYQQRQNESFVAPLLPEHTRYLSYFLLNCCNNIAGLIWVIDSVEQERFPEIKEVLNKNTSIELIIVGTSSVDARR